MAVDDPYAVTTDWRPPGIGLSAAGGFPLLA